MSKGTFKTREHRYYTFPSISGNLCVSISALLYFYTHGQRVKGFSKEGNTWYYTFPSISGNLCVSNRLTYWREFVLSSVSWSR
ncbi:hypothetical protein GBAR_LOCUS4601 [Geodia barretti]|uniref:Uncharacterized protein n=1 Tax=Geodia barretti TaxID=519541 RepID=A0AA35W3I5_GEOBA|nr:hypothetical protein GBAR_LOCUS4601 [Geodia barretti]